MENNLKRALAKILGEIYDLENQVALLKNEEPVYNKATIEQLQHGYEHIINQELGIDETPMVLSEERYYKILETLDKMEVDNPQIIENLTGFYDFPSNIQDRFSRIEWLYAFKAMKNEHRFNEIISRIEGSQNSPSEFHNLDFEK